MNQSLLRWLLRGRSLNEETVAAFGGAGTMFLIQPPCDLWFFAWLAPLPWLWLVLRKPTLLPPRFWQMLWCAGFVHWLATIHYKLLQLLMALCTNFFAVDKVPKLKKQMQVILLVSLMISALCSFFIMAFCTTAWVNWIFFIFK